MELVFGAALGALAMFFAAQNAYDNYEKSFEDRVNEEVRRRLSGVDVKVNARVELLEDDLGHVR